MTDTADLVAELADGDGERASMRRLHAWARIGEPELHRAGTLRGLAQLGTVIWAAGLGWAAQRGLETQQLHTVPAAVAPAAGAVTGGLALRAALLAAADRAAATGAARVRSALRARVLRAALPGRAPRRGLADIAYAEALDAEVARLDDWLTDYVPARRAMLLGSGVVLAAIALRSWFVALLLVLATPLLPANLKVIGMGTKAAVQAQLGAVRTLHGRLLDQLRGLPTLVGLGAQEEAARALRRDDEELARRTTLVLRVAFLSTAWVELLITGTLAVVATYCGLVLLDYLRLPGVPDHMSLATALFVLTLTPAYFAPARELARGYHARAQAAAAADLIAGAMRGSAPEPGSRPAARGAAPLSVRLREVSVIRPGRARPALDRVEFDIRAGEFVVVTGPSGAGKSTLLSVTAGLLGPDRGSVRHGHERATPAHVAWVGQPGFLLPGSVRENLRLVRPEADDSELLDAFEELGFGGLPAALPDGLDTPVGERGSGLSSGQSQQLVFVRALLRDAPLLCLDEPTAHLDPEAETAVADALRRLARRRTVLLATHSPALLPLGDRVITLEQGRLV
ncbi:ATP-binding cassette domain-containing protein [Streptomyces sp. GbtcB6]|uniref:ATP-binding cassette domain-containing protein n=1 Tax=Streptomyces sp. GbtcB6 TaxID=2824751 RepID=UPI0027E5A020|nr:ATP-binding cassette domain-containing protein [Streptomyces sp. GbtcB6]